GLIVPLLALRSRAVILDTTRPLPNRLGYLQRAALSVSMLTAISVLVARVQWIPLFPRSAPPVTAIVAGVVMYALTVAFMRPYWRRAVERGARVAQLFMPATGAERTWWIAVSMIAGIGEEITWRGVQTDLLSVLTGGFWTAAILSAASFALAHMIQGWK